MSSDLRKRMAAALEAREAGQVHRFGIQPFLQGVDSIVTEINRTADQAAQAREAACHRRRADEKLEAAIVEHAKAIGANVRLADKPKGDPGGRPATEEALQARFLWQAVCQPAGMTKHAAATEIATVLNPHSREHSEQHKRAVERIKKALRNI